MTDMEMTVPLTIVCGGFEIGAGDVVVPGTVKTGPADGMTLPVSVEADIPGFRANLAVMLRDAAAEIERCDFD